MLSRLEKCCTFVNSYKQITWNRTTLTICLSPFALLLVILGLLFLLAAENPGAVVSNSLVCSSVGGTVLEEGGSAVDAAIATMLCEGIALPNSAGIGGGFSAVIYANGNFDSIVATPTAPLAVQNITEFDESYTENAKSIGVPGELMGYWEMHRRYGVLSWKRLLEPSIKLCEQGVPITEWLAGVLRHHKESIVRSPTMTTVFDFSEIEGMMFEHRLKYVTMAETLKAIAKEGVDPFYKGYMGDNFIQDVKAGGGIMEKQDLENYKVIWEANPPFLHLKSNFKIVSTPLPTSGAVIVFILNIVKSFNLNNYPLFWHKMIEALKHAFGHSALLGDAANDPKYRERIMDMYNKMLDRDFARDIRQLIKDDRTFNDSAYYGSNYVPAPTKGSANICVLSPRGDAVAATTSILGEFGAFFLSPSTGIIMNNLLAQFANNKLKQVKVSPMNRLLPGKHAFSPHCPTIVIRQKTAMPFFIVGASGGSKATTLVATALVKFILNTTGAEESVNYRHFHAQLYPNQVEYEEEFDGDVVSFLRNKIGHELVESDATYDNFTAVTCIGARIDTPEASFDNRIGGSIHRVNDKSDLSTLLVVLIGGLAASVVGVMLYETLHPTDKLIWPIDNARHQSEV